MIVKNKLYIFFNYYNNNHINGFFFYNIFFKFNDFFFKKKIKFPNFKFEHILLFFNKYVEWNSNYFSMKPYFIKMSNKVVFLMNFNFFLKSFYNLLNVLFYFLKNNFFFFYFFYEKYYGKLF